MKLLVPISLCILPLWWIFLVIWQPGFVHVVAQSTSPAIDRALQYATLGGTQTEDIYFTQSEIAHLRDVSHIYKPVSLALNLLAIGAWTTLVVAVLKKVKLEPKFQLSAKILVGLLIVLVVCLLVFPFFFEKFHELLFPEGNWEFPADSMLITIFPEMFWKLILASIGIQLGIFAAVYWIVGINHE